MNVKPPETFGLDRLETPIGIALVVTDAEGALRALDWQDYEPRMRQLLRLQNGAPILQANSPPSVPSSGASPAPRSSARSGRRCEGSRSARR
jgi:hypothetical protein